MVVDLKILFKDLKKGLIKLHINVPEDLWYLSTLIKKGDIISGTTFRAVKFGNKEERKPVWIKMIVESVNFSSYEGRLRILGVIKEGKPDEFIQVGKHHGMDLRVGDKITIEKDWLKSELDKLNEAVRESKKPRATVVLIDDKKALIANIVAYGFDVLNEIYFNVSKRMTDKEVDKERQRFYEKIRQFLSTKLVIIGGPGFEKEKFKDYLMKKGFEVRVVDVGYAEISSLKELSERGILDEVLGIMRLRMEEDLFNEFLRHLMREDGLAVYGVKEVKQAIALGAVGKLLVDISMLKNEEIRSVLRDAENIGAKIILSTIDKIKGFGGLIAILRYPL